MSVLPAELSTGMVHGRFIVAMIDGDDTDQEPEAIPASGKIVFKASVPYVPVPVTSEGPVTVLKGPITGVLDSDGYLCTPHPVTSEPMYRGVKLLATDDPDMAVTDWTWTAEYRLDSVGAVTLAIAAHSFALPSGSEVDLTTMVKVPSSPGYGLPQAEAAVLRAEAAAVEAKDALTDAGGVLDQVALAASTVDADATRAETAADRAEETTDEMNAALIEDPASLTASALSAAIVEGIADESPRFAASPDTVFFAPLAKARNSANVRSNWWLCGDSKEESYGATTNANRAFTQVQAKLRALYPSGAPGGEFKKGRNNIVGGMSWINTFTYSGYSVNVPHGFGQLGRQLGHSATVPGKATLTGVTATEVEIYFYRTSSDQVNITIDGVLTNYVLPTNVTAHVWSSGPLPKVGGVDVHTIEIQQTGGTGSGPVLAGINLLNGDKAKGLHFYDHTSSGSQLSQFVGQAGDTAGAKADKETWANFLTIATPSLMVVEWLTNDCVTDNAALYEENVRKFITLTRSKVANVPFLLMPPEEPSDRVLISPWRDYLDGLARIAADTPNVRFYDITKRIPKQGNGNPYGIYMDAVHYAPHFQEV